MHALVQRGAKQIKGLGERCRIRSESGIRRGLLNEGHCGVLCEAALANSRLAPQISRKWLIGSNCIARGPVKSAC